MTDMFNCAASTVVKGEVVVRKDSRGMVHICCYGALGVSWTLSHDAALGLAHDIRCELDDDVAMYEPRAWDYCYRLEADEHTVSIRRSSEDTSLVLDNMNAEMLADWLEEGSRRTPSSPCSAGPSAGSPGPSWRTSSPT